MAWVGAIAVVIGIGLFIKFAYDEGWLRVVSPPMRCALSAAFGLSLIACGEAALRRVSRPASAGLFGAGLGTLFLTALVSFRLEILGSAGLTLVLLALVAALGVGIAVRGGLLSIGVVSIVAGYGAPLLVPGADAFAAALPTYLTMLLAIGLALSALRPRPFRTLRILTFAAHAALATLWILEVSGAGGWLELTFMSGWWMMITGEAVYAALRRQSSMGNAIQSLIATAWYVLLGCILLGSTTAVPGNLAGAFTAGVGVLAGAIAFQFGPGLDTLRRRPWIAIEKLAASLWVQAGSLLVIAAGLQFDDSGVTLAWMIMGLASIEIGRRLPSTAADLFGLVVGLLGLLRLVSLSLVRGVSTTAITIGEYEISEWGLLGLVGMAILIAGSWRLRSLGPHPWRRMPIALTVMAALLWLLITGVELSGMSLGVAWLGGAAALIALTPMGARLKYAEVGAGLIGAASLRLILVDLLGLRLTDLDAWMAATPMLNAPTLMGGAILVACAFLLWMDRRWHAATQRDDERPLIAVRSFMALLLLIILSFEIDRAVMIYERAGGAAAAERWSDMQLASLWLTLMWGLSGVMAALLALRQRSERLLNAGVAVAVVAGAVWLTWDTLFYRIMVGVGTAPVLFNAQCMVGVLLAIGLGIVARFTLRDLRNGEERGVLNANGDLGRASMIIIALTGLWLGSLEIDRFFNPETSTIANAAMARQTGLSIYWGVYGIAMVVIGFAARTAMSRYAGLGLLAATLLKVLLVDMGDVEYIYRVMSFIGVGLLFVLTSIAYAKLSPRLLAGRPGDGANPVAGAARRE